MMNILKRSPIVALAVVTLIGCAQPQTKTEKGALYGTGIGAAVGAGLGQAIGGDTKATLLGAGIGAALGGLTGGAVGRYMDNQEEALRQEFAASEAANVQRSANLLAVTFRGDVMFDFDSAALKPGAMKEINRVATVLLEYPQTNIEIEGHTDSTGAADYNQSLSERRALSVQNELINQGISPNRMTTVGFGETQPIADNGTEAGRQLNRRVVIVIAPQQGVAY